MTEKKATNLLEDIRCLRLEIEALQQGTVQLEYTAFQFERLTSVDSMKKKESTTLK